MGSSNWNPTSYNNYSRSVASASQQQIFRNTSGTDDELNPTKFTIRESCDSVANPESTPIILAVDETGSMGILATNIIKQGLGTIMGEIINRKPVSNPHLMLAALGDAYCDSSPIQATQFEADTVLVKQIEKFYLEGNGGGNGGESYGLVWWLAANKTKCDSFAKRGRKGYIFTVGDEACHNTITRDQIKTLFAVDAEKDVDVASLLATLQSQWNVFHLITPTESTRYQDATNKWRELLGERAITVTDWTKLAEVIVSLMQVNEGADKQAVAKSWDGSTGMVVASAIAGLSTTTKTTSVPAKVTEI